MMEVVFGPSLEYPRPYDERSNSDDGFGLHRPHRTMPWIYARGPGLLQ
jgi:hypothetical protein